MCRADHAVRRSQPDLELADIVRAHAGELASATPRQSAALSAIASCRTAALGRHREVCDSCGFEQTVYNSCRNRHCPKCQGHAQREWVSRHVADVLPVPYFHVVFTIPDHLHPLFLCGQAAAYDRLFAAAARTLEEVAVNPDRLGARVGFVAVLDTWTQTLLYHPHVHVLVPGGGLSPDGTRWIASRTGYFLPVRVLAEVFRGKLLAGLEAAVAAQDIRFDAADARRALKKSARKKWCVYAKPPFAGPEAVVEYLVRYTHRIAISNRRLVELRDGAVAFAYRDRTDGDARRTMTLPAREFVRRFLLHVLPRGFQRIRHYGFLANAVRRPALARCRELLGVSAAGKEKPPERASPSEPSSEQEKQHFVRCPRSKQGRFLRHGLVAPAAQRWRWPGKETSPP